MKHLDVAIAEHCDNWRFERLSAIDRAILRLAIHELQGTKTPHKVIINEAVNLAKKFSGEPRENSLTAFWMRPARRAKQSHRPVRLFPQIPSLRRH